MTINDTKYYESNTATASDAKCDLSRNPETVTHTSKGSFEQTLLSNRIIPVFSLALNPGVDQGIAPIILASQMLLTPVTKEVVADVVLGGAWKTRLRGELVEMALRESPQATFVMMLAVLNLPSQF